ncbi:NAD(P)-dependent alcohol dehydrogenase [Gordonia sp. CPCC 206044]|uniref:NAD(P)-dependent alcohol dehydrogenase n=1 Tax=Gordonia sp. CPCC 206044 TaxID=3140793 RepID=UPI003AF3B8A6
MRAFVNDHYGPPDDLRCVDLPDPAPGPGQVVLRVEAASLNPADWHYLRGDPWIARAAMGWRRPRRIIAGIDAAGTVVAIGSGVDTVSVGDPVVGYCDGAFAELAVAGDGHVVRRPKSLSAVDAASLPTAATTAVRAIRDVARVEPGQRVLVNGAAGGVGSMAVQVARHLGATVTGVCSAAGADLVRRCGASEVVDHTRSPLTTSTDRFDVALDNVCNHRIASMRRLLTDRGTLVVNGGGSPGKVFGAVGTLAAAGLTDKIVRQRVTTVPSRMDAGELRDVVAMVVAGDLAPTVSEEIGPDQLIDGLRRVEDGHTHGKIVMCPSR